MEHVEKLLEDFDNYWRIALNGDYSNGYQLSRLAKELLKESKKPTFKKHHLTLVQQMTLSKALILANIPIK